jgi:predicted transcriptional regulator
MRCIPYYHLLERLANSKQALFPGQTTHAKIRMSRVLVSRFVSCATSLPLGQKCSYTTGMKTAVSIPEDVFKGAERLARKTKRSRSRLFSDALKEYLARHTPDSVTEAMNKACSELGAAKDEFVSSAARRVLERSEW